MIAFIQYKIMVQLHLQYSESSIGLGFLNPTLRLKCWDETLFCMQLENIEDR